MRFAVLAVYCLVASPCLLSGCGSSGRPAGRDASVPQPPAVATVVLLPSLTLSADERTVLERFVGHATAYAAGLTPEKVRKQCSDAPEMFAWVAFPSLGCLLDAYELTGDAATSTPSGTA